RPDQLPYDCPRNHLRRTYFKNTLGASTGMDEMQSISRPTMIQISFAHTVEHTNGLENTWGMPLRRYALTAKNRPMSGHIAMMTPMRLLMTGGSITASTRNITTLGVYLATGNLTLVV